MNIGNARPKSKPEADLVKKLFIKIPILSKPTSINKIKAGMIRSHTEGALMLLILNFTG